MWKRVKKAKDATSVTEAQGYALRLLEFRFRGEDELRARLKEKEFTTATIEQTVDKLRDLKYLDDSRLLESLIREYKEFGLYGPVYIQQKLLQRKFTKEQIEKALKTFYTPEDELAVAKKFLLKQKPLHSGSPPLEEGFGEVVETSYKLSRASGLVKSEAQKEKQRIMQRFLRRGFSLGVVFKVLGTAEPAD